MKLKTFIPLASTAIILTGCNESSMFDKCVLKESQNVESSSTREKDAYQIKFGVPYYSGVLANLLDLLLHKVKTNNIATLEDELNIYREDPSFAALRDKSYAASQGKEYQEYLTALYSRMSRDISMGEYKAAKKRCGRVCEDVIAFRKDADDYLEAVYPEFTQRKKQYANEINEINNKLYYELESKLKSLPLDAWLNIAKATDTTDLLEKELGVILSNGEVTQDYKNYSFKFASLLSHFPLHPRVERSSFEEFAEYRIKFYKDEQFTKTRILLAPFTKRLTSSEIAVYICNERGLY